MKTRRYFALVLTILFVGGQAALAQQPENSPKDRFLSLKNQLNTAVDSANREEIARIAYAMERFQEQEELKKYARYYTGYAWYRMYTLPAEDGSEPEEEFLDSGVEQLEAAIELDPQFAEAHALLGSIYGMKASGMLSGIRYGPKSQSAIERAMELAPENPRVFLIDGIGDFYKPSMFGGGVDNAIESFTTAADLFPAFEPKSELAPDWGHAEVYAWLGQAYSEQEKYGEAEEAYQKALEIDPNYGWVKYVLLPALAEK